jgi:TonB-linked SusC/RagA family outer membrane protein
MTGKFLTILLLFAATSFTAFAQNITGLAVDIDGEPMVGVTVLVKGTTNGTVTDTDGKYTLNAGDNAKILVFSYLGYQTQEVEIADKTTINVVMREATQVLEDIVVVGYGHQKKVSVTGSISTVPMKNILSVPVVTLSNAIGGQLQGVTTQNTSGEPGADASIRVRGIGTWTDANPLILVDGIERNINFVNPQDVESMSVLKDASATAVYGVRGANGVILITTKKGKAGKTQVSFRTEYAEKIGTRFPDYISGWEFASLMNEATANENKPAAWTADQIQTFRDGSDPYNYPDVNWTDAIYNKTTNQTINTLNITGGTEVVRYYLSARHAGEGGLYKTDNSLPYNTNTRLNRYNLLSNIDVNVSKDLTLAVGLSSSIQQRNYPGKSATEIHDQTKYTSPIAIPLHNPDGSVSGTPTIDNAWAMATQSGYSTMYINTLQGTFSAKYDLSRLLTRGLSVSGKFSFDNYDEKWTHRTVDYKRYQYEGADPLTGEDKYKDLEPERSGTMRTYPASAATRQIYMDLGVNYDRNFGQHGIGALLIFNRQEKTNQLAGDELGTIPNRMQGLAGRMAYNYNYRYFAEINLGYNGSENFAPGQRYGLFPAFSAGWVVSNESFWKTNTVSNLKLRASWGKVGNDFMGTRFAYLTTINKNAPGYWWGSSQIFRDGYEEGKIGNKNVTWETAKKTNLGLDLGFFNNALNLTVDAFHELRENIFLQRQSVPAFAGYLDGSVPWGNLGKMENKGIDAKLELNNKTDYGLQYSLYGTFSFARNAILENDMPPQAYPYLDSEGRPLGTVWGLEALGLFNADQIAVIAAEDARVANGELADKDRTLAKQTFQTQVRAGDIRYQDQNGDGKIDDNDRIAIGYANMPEIMFGFGGSLAYKGVDLSIQFNGVAHRSTFLDGAGMMPYQLEYPAYNIFREYYDNRYIPATADNPTPDNSGAKYPAVIAGNNPNNYRTSTLYMRDASYIRLQTLEIGYSLPKTWMERIKISNIRLFASGNNLFVFDNIKITDPEMNQTGSYPKQMTVNFGAQIDF